MGNRYVDTDNDDVWMDGCMMIHETAIPRAGMCRTELHCEKQSERAVLECPIVNSKSVATQAMGMDMGSRMVCFDGTGRYLHRSSSTCSTESTISLISSRVTPGIMRSASVKARCRALRATRASCVETRGKS